MPLTGVEIRYAETLWRPPTQLIAIGSDETMDCSPEMYGFARKPLSEVLESSRIAAPRLEDSHNCMQSGF
jgi:hypothetical protein